MRRDPALKGKGLATAGLIISYATMIVAVGFAAFVTTWWSAHFKEAFKDTRELLTTNQPAFTQNAQAQTQMQSDATDQVPSTGSSSGWTMDVKDAQIPGDPVSGEIHGANFECKRVLYRNGNLKFLSADGSYLMIHGVGASIENSSFEFPSASVSDALRIEIAWKEDDQNQTEGFQDGYAMELKFDAAKRRKVPGQIYLCLPDDSKSYIAGTFTVVLPKPKRNPVQ